MRSLYPEHAELRGRVGMVIPAWYPPGVPAAEAARLLATTLADNWALVRLEDVMVVVDGSDAARTAAASVTQDLGDAGHGAVEVLDFQTNAGKGAALGAGFRRLLEHTELEWFGVRDADGDHFIEDLPHLYRIAEQVTADCPNRPVCVVGSRANVHAPLGWLRGEFELLLNEIVVDALAFALAREGRAWDTRYLALRAPDLQSGYKLYNRQAVEIATRGLETQAKAHPDFSLLRTGMEIVPFVEVALAGGIAAEVQRKTFYDQPVTSYGRVELHRFYGRKLAWALKRCAVPSGAATVLLDGALARRPLFTDPQGRTHALAMRELVMDALGGNPQARASGPRARRFL